MNTGASLSVFDHSCSNPSVLQSATKLMFIECLGSLLPSSTYETLRGTHRARPSHRTHLRSPVDQSSRGSTYGLVCDPSPVGQPAFCTMCIHSEASRQCGESGPFSCPLKQTHPLSGGVPRQSCRCLNLVPCLAT